MTLNDIPPIQKSLSIWEWVEWIATAFVFIGVAIEVAINRRIIKQRRVCLRKIGELLLVVGLAGELLALSQIQNLTDSLTEMLTQAIKFATALGVMQSHGM